MLGEGVSRAGFVPLGGGRSAESHAVRTRWRAVNRSLGSCLYNIEADTRPIVPQIDC